MGCDPHERLHPGVPGRLRFGPDRLRLRDVFSSRTFYDCVSEPVGPRRELLFPGRSVLRVIYPGCSICSLVCHKSFPENERSRRCCERKFTSASARNNRVNARKRIGLEPIDRSRVTP